VWRGGGVEREAGDKAGGGGGTESLQAGVATEPLKLLTSQGVVLRPLPTTRMEAPSRAPRGGAGGKPANEGEGGREREKKRDTASPVVLWPLPKDKELWPLPKDKEEESKLKSVERKESFNGMEETPFYKLAVRAQPVVGSSATSIQQAALDKRRLTNLPQNVLPEVPLLSDMMDDQDSSHLDLDQDSAHLQPPPSTKASPVLLHPPTSLPPNRVRVFY
jgi:hypothetical protein